MESSSPKLPSVRAVSRPSDFEVMIRDHYLGAFALHEEFVLEIPDSNHTISGWRPVSFSELMSVIWTAALMLRLDVVTDTISHLSQSHCRMERIPVEGDSSHIDRLHSSLQRARIGYQVVGGLDSRGRGRGHLTVAVSSLVQRRDEPADGPDFSRAPNQSIFWLTREPVGRCAFSKAVSLGRTAIRRKEGVRESTGETVATKPWPAAPCAGIASRSGTGSLQNLRKLIIVSVIGIRSLQRISLRSIFVKAISPSLLAC